METKREICPIFTNNDKDQYITLNLEPKPIDKTTKLENIKKSLANISRSVEFDKGFDKFIVSYLTEKKEKDKTHDDISFYI